MLTSQNRNGQTNSPEEFKIIVQVANVPEKFIFHYIQHVTVSKLVAAVGHRTGKMSKAITLRFGGKVLDKLDQPLSFYGIRSGSKVYASLKLLPGLDCLGPFTIVPNIGATYTMEGAPYVQMIGPKSILEKLSSLTGEQENLFQVSEKHLVTLPDALRAAANIPLGENVSFRWVYPFAKTKHSTNEKIKSVNPSDPLSALILFGGFLYVDDKNDQVVQVNGIKPGPGLYFDGPYKMSPECFELVFQDGRFQECTVELEGCNSFCWFIPGEDASIKDQIGLSAFTDDDGNEISIPHGAFGYECTEEGPRIFRISDNIPSGHFPVREFNSVAHQTDVTEDDDVQTCVICLEPYGDGDLRRVVSKPCNHACLHHACANQLLSASRRAQCPICRARVTSLERMPYL
jgi:hypothetical protein